MFPVEKFNNTRTPFYYYDLTLLRRTLKDLREAESINSAFKVHYAIKANANPIVLEEIRNAGLGVDAVSGGEISRALECGFRPGDIVFAGVGKSDGEIELGLENGIECFNVESVPELEVISELAVKRGKVARIAVRVNPNIDAHTHHYITTGLNENKFGIPREMLMDVVKKALELPGLEFVGLHFHIGSQLTDLEPYRMLCVAVNELQDEFETAGIEIRNINVGGGARNRLSGSRRA
ncbi:MAG: alanine racemase, partial [Muribaculaceae bacterium]|nr:alanine racemase [Muribaculaceae bacterium]